MNPATPLEARGHTRVSTSAEIAAYLHRLAATSDEADCQTLGYSVRGAPLRALIVRRPAAPAAPRRLRVMLVGSHHGGSEPAGGEALLDIARALLHGDLRELPARADFVLVPDVNPDGRDEDASRNANRVNLNRDYVLLSQPESRALNAAVQRYRPDVVLDAHESAALKRRTLGREGWLTEFEAQFDVANNPALPPALLHFGEAVLLPDLIARVSAGGLHAQRYIREITSTSQALTHGGTTIRRFRNKAGALGALSFLLETRLDPREGRSQLSQHRGADRKAGRVHSRLPARGGRARGRYPRAGGRARAAAPGRGACARRGLRCRERGRRPPRPLAAHRQW